MFEEEISFDNNQQLDNKAKLPSDIQDSVNTIVNNKRAGLLKNDTKEMLKGAVLGGLLGVILCLYRKKNVWLGVLAGGLAGGYLSRQGILRFPSKRSQNRTNPGQGEFEATNRGKEPEWSDKNVTEDLSG
tara:strand:+ start:18 stop:407 length:390 start_codon:yes stop_codon:yes gene_type:complete